MDRSEDALTTASTIVVLLASLGVGGMLIQSFPEQEKAPGWSRTFWAGMGAAVATVWQSSAPR